MGTSLICNEHLRDRPAISSRLSLLIFSHQTAKTSLTYSCHLLINPVDVHLSVSTHTQLFMPVTQTHAYFNSIDCGLLYTGI